MHTLEGAPHAPVSAHSRVLALVVTLLLPVFLGSLDGTIVATALPTIGRELHNSVNLSWIVSVYLLTSTAAAPLFGKVSDTYGRRFSMIVSQVIFLVGSVGCGLSPTMGALILSRAVQGVGSGGLITQAMTILGDVAAPKERARYYAYFSMVYTASGAIGPALGGFLAESATWRAIFWLNVPVGVIGLYLTNRSLRHLPQHHRRRKLDLLGAALIVAASVVTMFVLDAGGVGFAWLSKTTLEFAVLAGMLWLALALRLLVAPEPLIPLRILRNPIVRAATAANALGWGAMVALNIYLPIYLQIAGGFSPVESGLFLIVAMGTMNIGALTGAQIAARVRRYKLLPMAGLLVATAATLALSLQAKALHPIAFEILVALIGLGFGPTAPVTSVALQNAVNLNELGTSIASMTFVRNLFSTMLLAGFGAIVFGAGSMSVAPSLHVAHQEIAGRFAGIFAFSAASFFAAFLGMAWMEERPLAETNAGRLELE
jgi:MFS family permease